MTQLDSFGKIVNYGYSTLYKASNKIKNSQHKIKVRKTLPITK
jgi:hypothetical protein